MYKNILNKLKLRDFKPDAVMKILKFVYEKRNKAVQGEAKSNAVQKLRGCLYIRDVRADMKVFMHTIKREVGGAFSGDDDECLLYQKMQKKYFKGLKRIQKSKTSSLSPGKTSYNQPGKFYGLTWIITCIDKALTFNKDTSASILYSYFWWFLSITRG